jgi:hypothetical protein
MRLTIEIIFIQKDIQVFCEDIAQRQEIHHKISTLIAFIFGGAVLYGFTMGLYTSLLQALASALKVFILFLFTLFICLPTLHFIGLLFGYKMKFTQTLTVLLSGIASSNILLGSFAPISLFFLLSGSRYEVLMLIHIFIFGCCGLAGLYKIKQNMTTVRMLIPPKESEAEKNSELLLKLWFVLYMFIGAQVSYILAPFVGRERTFVFIRLTDGGDFFSEVFSLIQELL